MGAYWEIAREFNVSHNKQFAAHFEYNGGAGTGETSTGQYYGSRYQHAVLLGGAWNWHNADFSTTFSLQAMYKYYFKNSHTGTHPFNGFQTTAVWGVQLADGRVTCSGFADLWYDPNVKGKLIFLSEPQLWFNMNNRAEQQFRMERQRRERQVLCHPDLGSEMDILVDKHFDELLFRDDRRT